MDLIGIERAQGGSVVGLDHGAEVAEQLARTIDLPLRVLQRHGHAATLAKGNDAKVGAWAAFAALRGQPLRNPLRTARPAAVLPAAWDMKKPAIAGSFSKPTSGFEPLTPSLRVKCSTS